MIRVKFLIEYFSYVFCNLFNNNGIDFEVKGRRGVVLMFNEFEGDFVKQILLRCLSKNISTAPLLPSLDFKSFGH